MRLPRSFASALPVFIAALALVSLPVLEPAAGVAQSRIRTIHPKFTTIAVPGAHYTVAWGINAAGEMVGNYGQNINSGDDAHGFLYKDRKFKYFDYPGQSVTVPMGINDSGLIVGHAGREPIVGFLYNGKTFTTLHDGNYTSTFASGINNEGNVVGGAGSIYATQGFRMRNGHYEQVVFPGEYVYAYFNGVNDSDVAVGWTSSPQHGYVYKNGQFENVDFPGALDTEALGINDDNVVAGYYGVGGTYYAFVLRNGKYMSFRYPGAATFATGINALGQIVGTYTFNYSTYYGFVSSPIPAADFN